MSDKIISKGRVSATRGAAILGMSPYMSAFRAWQDIMEKREPGFNATRGYDYEPFDGNASTRWGHAFEDAIIKLSEERYGQSIWDREYHAFHPELDYVHCYLDGKYGYKVHTVKEIEAAPLILHEGKTTTSYGFGDKWGEPGTDRIPVEYQIQTQHQMLCTGADECIVSVLVFPKRPDDWEAEGITAELGDKSDSHQFAHIKHPDNGKGNIIFDGVYEWAATLSQMGFFHQYKVKADKELHALMLDKYRTWWAKHVLGKKLPDPVDYADIRAMITAPVGTIIVDTNTARWFKEFKDIGEEIGKGGNLSKRRDQLKTLILDNARALESTIDDESTDKWIFRDDRGNKLGSYGKNNKGSMVFR